MTAPSTAFRKYPRPYFRVSVFDRDEPTGNTLPQLDQLVTRAQACATLKLHRQTLRRWTLSGKLPAYTLGRSLGYHVDDVQRLLKEAKQTQMKKPGPRSKPTQ